MLWNNHVFALTFPGVKNADENELYSIASEPANTHVYNVADFNIMSSIVEGLTKTVCEQVEQQDKDIKQSKETTGQRARKRKSCILRQAFLCINMETRVVTTLCNLYTLVIL